MKLLLTTQPHGAQKLYETEEPQTQPIIGNRLYTLEDSEGRWTIMTGEELTSLANQWLTYAKARMPEHSEVSHPGLTTHEKH